MPRRFIDHYDLLIFDVCLTIMFGVDRFSEGEDFAGTYRQLGGKWLDDAAVARIVRRLWLQMIRDYRDPACYEHYPTIPEYLAGDPETRLLSQDEQAIMVDLFGIHESGFIPDDHAAALKELGRSHRLAIVSNITSPRKYFEMEFRRVGIDGLFEMMVFSSEHGMIKPSPRIFRIASEHCGVAPDLCLYVGDSLKRDVVGAKSAGMGVAWVDGKREGLNGFEPEPDLVVANIPELLVCQGTPKI